MSFGADQTMKFTAITSQNFIDHLDPSDALAKKDYVAMYSSQWKGVTTDPRLMLIPIDDHLVHRGDGGFDVMRCVKGSLYQLREHLNRLSRTMKAISMNPPPGYDQIEEIISSLVAIGGERDCLVRITVSRGPGSFSVNPYDTLGSQLYVNVIRYHEPPESLYRDGVILITSKTPIKTSFFANIKSCNYLPNALMKKEAIDAGANYSVGLDEEGFLAEGPTENIGVFGRDHVLRFPGFERTLSGITAKRVFELAATLVQEGLVKEVRFDKILPDQARGAREVFLTGTSINVLPVTRYDGGPIGDGRPGPVFERLGALLKQDMTQNQALLTRIDWDKGLELLS